MIQRFYKWESRILTSAKLGWVMSGVALIILTTTIGFLTLQLRNNLRSRILTRDATIMSAVADMQILLAKDTDPMLQISRPQDQLKLLLRISRLEGIMGLRLYDAEGEFETAYPSYVFESPLQPDDLPSLTKLNPVTRFYEKVTLGSIFEGRDLEAGGEESPGEPVLEIIIPLHQEPERRLLGSAQFLLRGDEMAREFASLDVHLATQAVGVWIIAGIPLVLILNWGLLRVRLSQVHLVRQSEQLQVANRELALAAKTSALGAMSAHLLHGLKSPVFCLQTLANLQKGSSGKQEEEWSQALVSIREMQNMINRVIQMLRDQEGLEGDVISLRQVLSLLRDRLAERLVQFPDCEVQWPANVQGEMNGREANLLLLVMENLLNNALEAVPKQGRISIQTHLDGERLVLLVEDNGPGLPEYLLKSLFQPCISTKPNGSGMGLAISRRLVESIHGTLELQSTGQGATVFRLSFTPEIRASMDQISLRY